MSDQATNIFEAVLGSPETPPVVDQTREEAQTVETQPAAIDTATGSQPETHPSTSEAQVQSGFDWSSFSEFGEGIDGPEALKSHIQGLSSANEQFKQELEKVKNQNPFSNPIIQKLNDYVSKSNGDPVETIQSYIELQATDYTQLSPEEKIVRHRMRESDLPRDVVELLVKEEFGTAQKDFGEPDEDWTYEERAKWEGEKARFAERNRIKEAQKLAAAKQAEKYFEKLKSETAIPKDYVDRQAQEAQAAQKKEAFLKEMPKLTQNAEVKLSFGEGKSPFAFKLTDQHLAKVQQILPTVPGIESMEKQQIQNVVEMLAWNTPEIRQPLLASMYKHIESQVSEGFHKKLGQGRNVQEGLRPLTNVDIGSDVDAILGGV